jgi:hypothetical protein
VSETSGQPLSRQTLIRKFSGVFVPADSGPEKNLDIAQIDAANPYAVCVRCVLAAIKAAREARTMCATHPAFEADYCPTCGTAQVI